MLCIACYTKLKKVSSQIDNPYFLNFREHSETSRRKTHSISQGVLFYTWQRLDYEFDLTLWRALQVTYSGSNPEEGSNLSQDSNPDDFQDSNLEEGSNPNAMKRVAILIPHLRVAILMMTKTRALVNPQTYDQLSRQFRATRKSSSDYQSQCHLLSSSDHLLQQMNRSCIRESNGNS